MQPIGRLDDKLLSTFVLVRGFYEGIELRASLRIAAGCGAAIREALHAVIAFEETLGQMIHGIFRGHEHVHLPGENQKTAEVIKLLFDSPLLLFHETACHPIRHDLDQETQLFQNPLDKPGPPVFSEIVRSPTLELKIHMVFCGRQTAESVENAVVIPHPRAEVQILIRNDRIAPLPESLATHVGSREDLLAHHGEKPS